MASSKEDDHSNTIKKEKEGGDTNEDQNDKSVSNYLSGFVVFEFGRVDGVGEIYRETHHLVHPQGI